MFLHFLLQELIFKKQGAQQFYEMAEMSIAKMNKVLRKTRIQGRSPSAFQIYMEEQRLELGVYFNSNQEAVNRFLPEWKVINFLIF